MHSARQVKFCCPDNRRGTIGSRLHPETRSARVPRGGSLALVMGHHNAFARLIVEVERRHQVALLHRPGPHDVNGLRPYGLERLPRQLLNKLFISRLGSSLIGLFRDRDGGQGLVGAFRELRVEHPNPRPSQNSGLGFQVLWLCGQERRQDASQELHGVDREATGGRMYCWG
jgi:hypothetical protein